MAARVAPERSIQRDVTSQAAAVAEAPASAETDLVTYTVYVILQGARETVRLHLTVVSADNPDEKSETLDLSKVKAKPYKRDDPTVAGSLVQLSLNLPASFKPGVIILNKFPEPDHEDETAPFVASIELEPEGTAAPVVYSAYTYVDLSQSDRWAFPATQAYPGFPGATPKGLEHFRSLELQALRGTKEDEKTTRKNAERIYQYDVYNDLGNPTKPETTRPVLGGETLKYPRRLRTGRTLIGPDESPTPGTELPWLPFDERFNSVKNHAFNEDLLQSGGRAARSVLGTPRGISFALSLIPFLRKMYSGTPRDIFTNLSVVDALYEGLVSEKKDDENVFRGLLPVARLETIDVLNTLQKGWRNMDDGLKKALGLLVPAQDIDDLIEKKKAQVGVVPKPKGFFSRLIGIFFPSRPAPAPVPYDGAAGVGQESLGERVDDAVGLVRGLLEKWPVPRVREGRALEWRSDEEFGRSALSGQNPFTIRAVTAADLKVFTISDSDVAKLLEGKDLNSAQEAGRLWVLDYYSGYKQYLNKVAHLPDNTGVLHAGRCLFYTRNDDITVPVAIELETAGDKMRVFTPKGPAEVWMLAKTIISSLDSGIHQLISHWLRTHAAVEPYIIAARRELSVMNPVYKILKPHFRYTMRINCNARKSLISAGGIIESCFTPGPFGMELSAVVYDSWRFDEQALPADLLKRGVAVRGEDGKLKVTLPHYRYAEDGLLLWDAILDFVKGYLKVHYNDTVEGRKVTDDEEITAWWKSVRLEGHPDTKSGWPEITDIASLSEVLASIMWVASCHHAAVNFGQYDNSAYFPYKPSKIIAKIPKAGSREEKDLRNRFESVLLNSISDPLAALEVMVTIKILSAHAADEEYLDRAVHSYIKEPEGVAVHTKFVDAVNAAEKEIERRNQNNAGGERGLPYTLLIPSNPTTDALPGGRPTSRGIPFSISI